MNFQLRDVASCEPHPTSIICPRCGKGGTFGPVSNVPDLCDSTQVLRFGHRICPDMSCRAHVFVVEKQGKLVTVYPPTRIAFDRAGVPEKVLAAFDEAVTCFANRCYVASAIMLRKTLEEICADKSVTGATFSQSIDSLRDTVILPPDFLKGMHDLRALGNDGTHVELKTFPQVTQKEVFVAINVTKMLLTAVYQFASVMTAMEALKAGSNDDPLED